MTACGGADATGPDSNALPEIREFTVSPDSGEAPLNVSITLRCQDPDGSIQEHRLSLDHQGSASAVSQMRAVDTTLTLTTATEIRGSCRDDAGASVQSEERAVSVTDPLTDRPYAVTRLEGFGTEESEYFNGTPFRSYAFAVGPEGQVVGMAEREAPRGSMAPARWRGPRPEGLFPDARCERGVACEGTAHGLSGSGIIVGRAGNTDLSGSAWVWEDGRYEPLPALAGDRAVAMDVNDVGEVVGFSEYDPDLTFEHAVIWRGDSIVDLGTFGGVQSQAQAISESGHIVGWARVPGSGASAGARHAFLWTDGEMRDLGTLGRAESIALGLNDQEVVVGWVGNIDAKRAFVWEGGTMRRIDPGVFSSASDVNASGEVVGWYVPEGTTDFRAVLWKNGERRDLSELVRDTTIALEIAHDINDAGQIVATGYETGSDREFAYFLDPASTGEADRDRQP